MRSPEVVEGEAWSPRAGLIDHYIPGGVTSHVLSYRQAAEARTPWTPGWHVRTRAQEPGYPWRVCDMASLGPAGGEGHTGSSPPLLTPQGCISKLLTASEEGRRKRDQGVNHLPSAPAAISSRNCLTPTRPAPGRQPPTRAT